MEAPRTEHEERLTVFQLMLLVLSILVGVALVVDTVAPVSQNVSTILQTLDLVVCGLFFVDFCFRFARAESKRAFMKWGWIDLLASIPNVDILRVGRLVRVLRIIRLLRGIRAGQRVVSLILENKPKSAMASVILTMVLLITFASISILIAETGPETNIKSPGDAIWWSITTITTVGYGDKYPTTLEGRMVAMVLMLAGVGLFGTLSGLVASFFLGQNQGAEVTNEKLLEEIQKLRTQVEDLQKKETWKD